MAAKGKIFLIKGIIKGCYGVGKATSLEPEFILHVTTGFGLFCLGKDDRAIDICLEILEKQPLNVHANCNAALFILKAVIRQRLQNILNYKTNKN